MKRFRRAVTLVAMAGLLSVPAFAAGADYTLLHAHRFDTSGLSSIGQNVFQLEPASLFARSEHFHLLAPDRETLDLMAAEAEFAYGRIRRIFRGADEDDPALLAMIRSASTWDELAREHGLREDGLALQIGRELYFKDDDAMKSRPDRIFHEMVHLRLRELHGETLPLWLEEGLANHYGWRLAVDYHRDRGIELTREFPALDEQELFSLNDMLEARAYPESPVRTRIFYRQAEALVRLLDERFSRGEMERFVGMMSGDLDQRPDDAWSSSSSTVTTERDPPAAWRAPLRRSRDDAVEHGQSEAHSSAVERFRHASGLDIDAETAMLEKLRDETLQPTID